MTLSSAPIIRAAQVTPISRLSRGVAWAAVAYALAVGVGLAIVPLSSPTLVAAPAWVALPVQLTAMLLCSLAALRATDKSFVTRPIWLIVLAFCALSAASTVVRNVWRPQGIGPVFSYADALYLIDYAMLTAAYLLLITQLGERSIPGARPPTERRRRGCAGQGATARNPLEVAG